MASALDKFKQLEQQVNQSDQPQPTASAQKPQRKKLPDLYQHIASKFEGHDEAKKRRLMEIRKMKEEEKKMKEEEELRRKEEQERIKKEKQEKALAKKLEEERKRQEEEKRKREEEEERLRLIEEEKRREEEEKMKSQLTARSMYEQALQKKQGSSQSKDKVVTLRKGTIGELRSKLFEKKKDVEPPKAPIKPKSKKKNAPPVPKKTSNSEPSTAEVKTDAIDKEKVTNEPKNEDKMKIVEKSLDSANKIDQKESKDKESETNNSSKKPKRQSVITDFAALEKTCKILGLYKEPAYIPPDETEPKKKRHASEGKKKKNKDKNIETKVTKQNLDQKDKQPDDKLKLDVFEKGMNEAKRNFFQEMIDQKKGAIKEEPVLLRAQKRRKTNLVAAFEEKTIDETKRNSVIKEDVKVDGKQFATNLNKFEAEDKRAEAKQKIAQLTAQQKKFEERKKLLEDELERRKREEEEHERLIQMQLEEQIMEQQRIQEEEDRLREEYEQQQIMEDSTNQNLADVEEITEPVVKKTKKVKKKKKKESEPKTEETPQLKLGFVGFSESKNKFEALRQQEDQENKAKQIKVNKLDTSNLFQQLSPEKDLKENPIKVNKLKKNPFMQQLEKNSAPEPQIQRKKISDGGSKKAEIRFASKKQSIVEVKQPDTNDQVLLRPKVRGSKSIENPMNTKCKKSSSTLSLFIDNTKEFFRNSREKLFRLSKEAINEIDQIVIDPKEVKPSSTEMQNYLLSHVLFDNTEKPQNKKKEKSKKKTTKKAKKTENDFEEYLDKDYKERIEQYCSLVEDSKPKSKKKNNVEKVEKLPQIKMVEVKSIQEQLKSQLQNDSPKKIVNEDLDCIKSNKVREVREQLNIETNTTPLKSSARQVKVNNSIIDKIKQLERAEEDRLKREKENEERIQKLLEQEMERVMKWKEREKKEKEEKEESTNDIDLESQTDEVDDDLKDDIRKRLEEEIENLEEEQRELETTEQLLIEEERIQNEDDGASEGNRETFREIKENLNEKKKQADEHKKVLRRFQHIFEKEENEEEETNKRPAHKVGSIHEKIESFLNSSESEKQDKKFEDSVLTGVSDIMSKVKNRFEAPKEDSTPVLRKGEVRRKLVQSAIIFEQLAQDVQTQPVIEKQVKEWSWKNKSPEELEQMNRMIDTLNDETDSPSTNKSKKDIRDLKFEEMLDDINAVKERMKHRDLQEENKAKLDEMNMFMDEIQNSLDELEKEYQSLSDSSIEEEIKKEKRKKKVERKPFIRKKNRQPGSSIVDNIKKELLTTNGEGSNEKQEKDELGICVKDLQKKIFDNLENSTKKEKEIPSTPGLVSKLSEILVNDEKEEYVSLNKAPKILLRTTSKEEEEPSPTKTLEELKQEQQAKKWAWKEKDMKDIQNYLKSYDEIIPDNLKQNQKTLDDLDEELNVVKSYMPGKETALIAQIREEKEKEFDNFMSNIQNFLGKETKSRKEGEFKKEMKTYLDFIDDSQEHAKSYRVPEVKTKNLNKLKKQLFEEQDNEPGRSSTGNISKIPNSLIEKIEAPQKDNARVKPLPEVGGNQTSIVKSYFEKKQEIPESPVIKPKNIAKSVLELKSSKSTKVDTKYTNQLKYKLKTILELHTYIESHENLCIPTMIEAIRNFSIAKKEEERCLTHKRFIALSRTFTDQKARSDEQKIYKDNIRAYLDVIENSDVRINGTPKLQKHTPAKVVQKSSNSKKKEIEKGNEKPASLNYLTPEEKRKQILKKYGFKDHVANKDDDVSSISSDNDEQEDLSNLTDNDLCLKYGLPPIDIPESRPKEQSSASSFKSILSKIRQVSVETNATSSPIMRKKEESSYSKGSVKEDEMPRRGSNARIKDFFEGSPALNKKQLNISKQKSTNDQENLPKSGSNARIKDLFESGTNESPAIARRSYVKPENNINTKLIKKFEDGMNSPQVERKSFSLPLEKSSTGTNIQNLIAMSQSREKEDRDPQNDKDANLFSIEKSRSFSKFKEAFETGVGLNDDEDSDEEAQTPIKSELKALKSSKKIQSMFRINRSSSDAQASPRLKRDIDNKTMSMISKSKSAITSMLESKTPKMTFGGSKTHAVEPAKEKKTVPTKSSNSESGDGRKWVFDTIQKYFDVIVEEDQEGENLDDDFEDFGDQKDKTQIENDDESDYTSAEEELPESKEPETKLFSPKVVVKEKVDISKYFQNKPVYTPTLQRKMPQVRSPSTPIDYPAQEQARRKFSLDQFVDTAAKEFDALTDGSDLSLDDEGKFGSRSSCLNLNSLSRSGSSTRIRGLFNSVVHGSANDLNVSVFKSNLMNHLTSKRVSFRNESHNFDPGVADGDSSSEYSEYDD